MLAGATNSKTGEPMLKGLNDIMQSEMLPHCCEARSISSKCIAACLQITCQTGLTSRGEADSERIPLVSLSVGLLAIESPVEQPLPVEQFISILVSSCIRHSFRVLAHRFMQAWLSAALCGNP